MAIAKFKKLNYKYSEEQLDINELPPITYEDAKDILFMTQDIMNKINLDIYLAYGTLLGAVREKNFIKGDLDVDVYVKDEKTLFENLEYIEKNGLKLIRALKHSLYSFRNEKKPNCYIDIYIMNRPFSIWSLYCMRIEGRYVPIRYVQDGRISFLGRTFCCPANPEKVLEFWYCDTWNVPIGKFEKQYKYDVNTHYYYAKVMLFIRNTIKCFLKVILGEKKFSEIKAKYKGNEY